ncbi:MAG TPA: hypothetical protein VHD32_06680 [Candidatus Didemnitutus sp.]|nr:hypothetical protein [Candidatus Didemnitutus sp.]
MDDARIKELVEELDRAIPKDGASISFRQYGGGPDESKIVGSRTGLLRAGIELLRVGTGSVGEKGGANLADLRALTHSESDYQFDFFEEKLLPEDRTREIRSAWLTKLIGFGILALILLTVGFAIYGVMRLFI